MSHGPSGAADALCVPAREDGAGEVAVRHPGKASPTDALPAEPERQALPGPERVRVPGAQAPGQAVELPLAPPPRREDLCYVPAQLVNVALVRAL